MVDLVARLSGATLYQGHGEESDLPERAADEIERLRAGLEDAYWRAKEHGLPEKGPSLSCIVVVLGYQPKKEG